MNIIKVVYLIVGIINFFVYLYVMIEMIYIMIKTEAIKGLIKINHNNIEKLRESNKEKGKSFDVGVFLGSIFIVFLLMLPFIAAILISKTKGLKSGIIFYIVIELLASLRSLLNRFKRDDYSTKTNVRSGLTAIFKIQLLLIISLGFNFNLLDSINDVYKSNIMFSNILTILLPITYIGIIVFSLYLYNTRMLLQSNLSRYKNLRIKYSTVLIIFVLSSFAGLIYLFETKIDFSNNKNFDSILNIFILALGSILIPSLLVVLRNKENLERGTRENEKHQKTKHSSKYIQRHRYRKAKRNR